MKQLLIALPASALMILTGCAEVQHATQGFYPSQPQGTQQASYEGGQSVQYIPPSQNSQTNQQRYETQNQVQQDSSFIGDLIKSATDSVKSEASGTIRSGVRGMFNR